jgi:hypothetical protein
MAKLQVMTLENLQAYDPLIKDYINDAVGTAEAKSLKTVAIDGKTLKFYKVAEPVGDTAPAYEITLPETDISGLLAKLTGATEGNVVVANADGTVKDGGVKLADLALKSEVTAVSDIANANKTALDEIKNADTGLLKTAKDYADEKVKALADGQVKTNTEAIATLNGADTEDGSVAKAVKDSADAINAKIGTLADLDTTAKTDLVGAINEVLQSVEAGGTGSVVTMTTDTTTDGYLKTYTIKQGTTEIGKIDIPKDLVVSSGEVVVDPDGQPAGTYVKLTIANQEAPVYINVADLVDAYTAQASATQIQLAISDTNEISATIVAGSVTATELATDSVTTVKIADGNVTLAKLGADVTPTLTQVATNKTNIEALQTLVGEGVTSISTDDINALFTP